MKKLIHYFLLEATAIKLKHKVKFWWRKISGKDKRIFQKYFTENSSPKLQIACGTHQPKGWLNTDYFLVSSTVACLDVTGKFPFGDNTFDVILAEHVIEHFEYLEGKSILKEVIRTLKPGGTLRLSTPDIQFYVRLFEEEIFEKFKESYVIPHQKTWVPYADEPRATFVLNNLVRNWRHLFIYDLETISALLAAVGMTEIQVHQIGVSNLSDLMNIDRLARDLGDFERMSNLVLEAKKPVDYPPSSTQFR